MTAFSSRQVDSDSTLPSVRRLPKRSLSMKPSIFSSSGFRTLARFRYSSHLSVLGSTSKMTANIAPLLSSARRVGVGRELDDQAFVAAQVDAAGHDLMVAIPQARHQHGPGHLSGLEFHRRGLAAQVERDQHAIVAVDADKQQEVAAGND